MTDAEVARERTEQANTFASKSKLESENAWKEYEKCIKDAKEAKKMSDLAVVKVC